METACRRAITHSLRDSKLPKLYANRSRENNAICLSAGILYFCMIISINVAGLSFCEGTLSIRITFNFSGTAAYKRKTNRSSKQKHSQNKITFANFIIQSFIRHKSTKPYFDIWFISNLFFHSKILKK